MALTLQLGEIRISGPCKSVKERLNMNAMWTVKGNMLGSSLSINVYPEAKAEKLEAE